MSSRLYVVTGQDSLEDIFVSLNNVRLTNTQTADGETYELHTVVNDLHWADPERSILSGTLTYETLRGFRQIDDSVNFVTEVNRADFSFFFGEIKLFLAVFSNRYTSENVANKIDYILNRNADTPHPIVFNQFISTTGIERFLREHPLTIKYCGWAGLDFIGVSKSSLGGANVFQFEHARLYDAHGRKSYVIFELNDNGWVMRISEEGIVTFYTSIPKDVALRFIMDEVESLIS
jgi:hypothetical protein